MSDPLADAGPTLAERIAAFTPRHLTPRAASRARALILDSVGATLAGTRKPGFQHLLDTPGLAAPAGAALVFGTNIHTSAPDAALLNATAGALNGAAPLVAELFALGQDRNLAGDVVVTAFALGHDLLLRAGERRTLAPVLASAAAAARVIGLDAPATLRALRIAAGFGAIEGAQEPLAHGAVARHGVIAALLAERGYDPEPGPALAAGGLPEGAPLAIEGVEVPEGDPWEAFEANAEQCLPRDRVAPLFETLDTLDKVKNMSLLARLLEAGTQARPDAAKVVFAARGTHEQQETTWVP